MATAIARNTVTSRDGTVIAYSQSGQGPALILVDGALCYRQFGPSQDLAAQLAPHFTVITYDRRGRGESGDTQPYAVEREVEDLAALLEAVGGTAYVAGQSSGAGLALEAANRLPGITKLALYEAPFVVDDTGKPVTQAFLSSLEEAVARNQRSKAVKLFMRQVGAPGLMLAVMPLFPMWSKLTAVAHTLPYDINIIIPYGQGKPLPATLGSAIKAPTLVMDGGKSPTGMQHAMQALAQTLPKASYRTLAGQNHMVKADALAPALIEFLTA
ncbi:alpha/beta hydrolase [Ktedonosporobacter rubrisoli]|uniref:Alpha/beta hydrolase n=1 Tax=Ktedonosporobacter rubrisoli TaxID=2509675 RepID=A0A4P6JK90_KTERU|nr:alpha/beta hydrolase [Ktedonosporobacter rubrisoli]QBD75564.1 alpha/beta hydrolase [Ktedonosporobacter rubrisoli]